MLLPALLTLTALALPATAPQDPDARSEPAAIAVRELLAIPATGTRGRSPVFTDPVLARLARGAWTTPTAGETLAEPGFESRTWQVETAGDDGWFAGRPFRGGWAVATVDVPRTGAWRLDLRGASMVFVDGEPRAGDVYALGTTRLPMHLTAGRHELLFRGGRGRLFAQLEPAPSAAYLEDRDRTTPDLIRGSGGTVLLGQLVSNANDAPLAGLSVVATAGGSQVTTRLAPLPASSQRKCAIQVPSPAVPDDEQIEIELALIAIDGNVLHRDRLTLSVREPNATHTRTFASGIDGSIQYYAVTPPRETATTPPGLLLSLHGAGVEARGQAGSYAPKPDMVVIAPTNRRPFGFDWEDQGRRDAIEVLDLASRTFGTDPLRTWLTGHSMGGHGTWQVGAHFPERFAAIGPSAGWRDFWAYAGGATFEAGDPIGALFARAANPSRTALLERNYADLGVYVLHGDADDNVPVSEARAMRERLATFHRNFAYYEQPGAGHWWGNQCVDWPPLIDFVRRNTRPEPHARTRVAFVTVNPAISSRCDWVTIEQQERALAPTSVIARLIASERRIELELDNVARLALDLTAFASPRGSAAPLLTPGTPLTIRCGDRDLLAAFDDPTAPIAVGRALDGAPALLGPLPPHEKTPARGGSFKLAFDRRMVFVYGTQGTAAENAWARAKARYDHETWRYRGNGAVDVLADVDFDPTATADRNVILYGHRGMNAAWQHVLGDDPAVDVDAGRVRVGTRSLDGDDLALLAIRPRLDSEVASVGIVAGTGLPGLWTLVEPTWFVSGVHHPDWTVFRTSFLREGITGIVGAGFFANDWSIGADSSWR